MAGSTPTMRAIRQKRNDCWRNGSLVDTRASGARPAPRCPVTFEDLSIWPRASPIRHDSQSLALMRMASAPRQPAERSMKKPPRACLMVAPMLPDDSDKRDESKFIGMEKARPQSRNGHMGHGSIGMPGETVGIGGTAQTRITEVGPGKATGLKAGLDRP